MDTTQKRREKKERFWDRAKPKKNKDNEKDKEKTKVKVDKHGKVVMPQVKPAFPSRKKSKKK